ncbi:MAG: 3-deoxy-7-phosphoheptulonate synthase [Elusimicrobia bacterium]|nr:3-deoxy-7-phosphoheptulonate synthase [Elusimicrobiota bacterium]
MIIRFKPGCRAAELNRIQDKIADLLPGAALALGRGFISVRTCRPELLGERLALIENLPGVHKTELSLKETCPRTLAAPPPELAGLFKKNAAKKFIIIAGPCAIEDEASYLAAAVRLKAAGVGALRAALFKPRTSPYSFQGVGGKGFAIIKKAKSRTGLAAVTEATSETQLADISRFCDVVQIGARNMRNYELLKAAAVSGKPVLLKRAPGATLKEWLLSAEYLIKYGNENIILCERGDSFSKPDPRGLDLKMIRRALTAAALPVIADPSHAAGDNDLVPAQALAAVRAGADGLMLETALNPESAIMDGRQTLTIPAFAGLLKEIRKLR